MSQTIVRYRECSLWREFVMERVYCIKRTWVGWKLCFFSLWDKKKIFHVIYEYHLYEIKPMSMAGLWTVAIYYVRWRGFSNGSAMSTILSNKRQLCTSQSMNFIELFSFGFCALGFKNIFRCCSVIVYLPANFSALNPRPSS